jgi:uncharacterized repeat protein (TIGR03803 family)
MTTFTFSRYAFCIGAAAALLTGCGAPQSPIGAPVQAPLHRILRSSSSYQLLHRFPTYANGGFDPHAPLIDVNGTLYGTTMHGGSSTNCTGGCGTVFSVDASGKVTVLHNFTAGSDGAWPTAALLDVNGTLYGTTEKGGTHCSGGCGTVYSISASGSENVLHSFGGGKDGDTPQAPLVDVSGTLYGTTVYGGNSLDGTVYSITASGSERVLHDFGCGSDGCLPGGGLISVNGTLYGTTSQGGGGGGCGGGGCGTVYSISASGSEKVLYRFADGSDGASPGGSLVNVGGTLFGTTARGGGSGCDQYGCGTAYSITTTGTEQVIHRFTGGDGALPQDGPIDVNGTLYGTTLSGGRTSCIVDPWLPVHGCGTIYSLTASGKESVRFRFRSEDVGEPTTSLLNVRGVLYGTTPRVSTRKCGAHSMTCGTVFAFTL